MHRDFGLLSDKYQDWAKDGKARDARQSFWDHIGDKPVDEMILYDLGAKSEVEKNTRGRLTEFQGNTVDTTQFKTIQAQGSNNGWGVFAVTTDGRLHVGKHSNADGAMVRHTSLTGGAPILATGEICIVNGKIVAISNLTGHYKLGAQQFFDWITTSPLVPPEVVVKARLNVKVQKETKSKSGEITTEIVSDYMIGGSTVAEVCKWVAQGQEPSDYPLTWNRHDLKKRDPQADFLDAREPDGVVVEAELRGPTSARQ